MINDREKTMALLLKRLGFSEDKFNTYWKLGIDTLEEMFLSSTQE